MSFKRRYNANNVTVAKRHIFALLCLLKLKLIMPFRVIMFIITPFEKCYIMQFCIIMPFETHKNTFFAFLSLLKLD